MANGAFDVAVVGRGLIGSAAARHLAESGQRVVAIGPDEPTDWSSWTGPYSSHFDEGRITRVSDRNPIWSEVARRSIERYPDIEARSGITVHHPVGLVISTPDLNTWLDTSRANGAPVEPIDHEWLEAEFGIVLADGAPAAFESAPAGFINPRRLVAAQTALARLAGASIVAETAMSLRPVPVAGEVRGGAGSVSGSGFEVGGPWGSVTARRVVLASGSFGHGLVGHGLDIVRRPRTVLLAELAPIDEGTGVDSTGAGGRSFPSLILRDQSPNPAEPSGPAEPDEPAPMPPPAAIRGGDPRPTPTDERLSSVYWVPPVRYPDGRTYLKIGGVLDSDPVIGSGPEPDAELVEWFHGAGDPVEAEALLATLEALLPGRSIRSTATVPCVYTGTPTGYPFIDWFDDGLVVAIGGNGAAAKSSDELGRLAAALVSDGQAGAKPDPEVFGLVMT